MVGIALIVILVVSVSSKIFLSAKCFRPGFSKILFIWPFEEATKAMAPSNNVSQKLP